MMQGRCLTTLLIMIAFLAACGPAAGSRTATSDGEQPAVTVQPANVVTSMATTRPPPPPDSISYHSSELGITFDYPNGWHLQEAPSEPVDLLLTSFDPASPPHKLEWDDTTVTLSIRSVAAEPAAGSLETWLQSKKQEVEAAHLEVFEEQGLTLANGLPAARLIVFSGSGGIVDFVLVDLDGNPLEMVVEGNFGLAQRVLDTLRPAGD